MAASNFTPKERPTNADLQAQNAEMHACLDQVERAVNLVKIQVAMLSAAQGVTLPTIEEMQTGAAPRRVRRRLGGLSPWQALAGGSAAAVSGMSLYKVLEPAVIAGAEALHHALMTFHP